MKTTNNRNRPFGIRTHATFVYSENASRANRRMTCPGFRWSSWLVLFFALALITSTDAKAQFVCPQPPPGAGTPQEAQCGNPEFQSCGINVNGINRHFCIHRPQAGPDPIKKNLPVIFGFHGGGGDAKAMVSIWEKHTEQGMVLVAPSALVSGDGTQCKESWRGIEESVPTWADLANMDGCAAGPVPPLPKQKGGVNGADLDFVRELVSVLNNDQHINPTGFYAAGFSSGAFMVYQLFITLPHANIFDGFAAVSNVIKKPQIDAQAALLGIPAYRPNHDVKKPFLFIIGTNEKVNAPKRNIIEWVDTQGHCLPLTTAQALIRCWASSRTYLGDVPSSGSHAMFTPRYLTTHWLVNHNNSLTRAIESLYPDLGHGRAPESQSDKTITVRQDFIRRPGVASAPVSVLTIIDGVHKWPGKKGNHPPCASGSCDIDATEEILQFWRANAGLRNRWQ